MTIYYFDIHDGEALPDRQGMDLANLAEAQAYALQMAMSFLIQDSVLLWNEQSWTIDVCDANRSVLYSMRFEMSERPAQTKL